MKPLVIVGAGGHGAVVAEAALSAGAWSSISFHDDRWPQLTRCAGFAVVGDLPALRQRLQSSGPAAFQVVVAIGANAARLALTREFLAQGVKLATVVHPTAVLSRSCTLGAGTMVIAGAIVNARSVIGIGCIINTGAIIDHDTEVCAGTHICPRVALAGQVRVGELVTIGIGACVVQGRRIGDRAVVGAGTTVIHDVDADSTVVGNPAREI